VQSERSVFFDNSNPNEGNSTMPSFKDCESRSWDLRIDVDVIRRVRTVFSIDLARALADPETIDRLTSDIVLTIDVIYEICRPVAEKIGVTAELFGRSLAGDALGHAVTAFEEALVEFLPESNRRATARRILEAGKALQNQTALRITNAMDNGLLEKGIQEQLTSLDQMIEKAMQKSAPSTGQPSSD
jgi:hypothetical protein